MRHRIIVAIVIAIVAFGVPLAICSISWYFEKISADTFSQLVIPIIISVYSTATLFFIRFYIEKPELGYGIRKAEVVTHWLGKPRRTKNALSTVEIQLTIRNGGGGVLSVGNFSVRLKGIKHPIEVDFKYDNKKNEPFGLKGGEHKKVELSGRFEGDERPFIYTGKKELDAEIEVLDIKSKTIKEIPVKLSPREERPMF